MQYTFDNNSTIYLFYSVVWNFKCREASNVQKWPLSAPLYVWVQLRQKNNNYDNDKGVVSAKRSMLKQSLARGRSAPEGFPSQDMPAATPTMGLAQGGPLIKYRQDKTVQ